MRAQEERVVLQATSPAGVPLHPEERAAAVSARLPDRTEVQVVRWSDDRRWLEVRDRGGVRGWITARYVAPAGTEPAPLDPWSSRQACLALLASRPARDPAHPRIASWNLRWFPDGTSSADPARARAEGADVEWVACILASLRVDAVALQEVVLHPRGVAAVERLRARLGELAGGRWEVRFDGCPRDGRQHVGWLVDVERAQIVRTEQLDAINPLGACAGHLRPGLAARLRFRGGVDVSAIVVHLDSGESARDRGHRRESIAALLREARAIVAHERDPDVLVLGDFNTMGCRDCPGRVTSDAEIEALDRRVAASLTRASPSVPCTELYRGHGALLDHALVSSTLHTEAEVHGPCARHACRLPRGARPPMLDAMSDHCPITIELAP